MNHYIRDAKTRRQHRKYDAIFGAVATLAIIGGGYMLALVVHLLMVLLGVG